MVVDARSASPHSTPPPSARTSRLPGFGVATTGVPQASASRYGNPKPSYVEGDTYSQACRYKPASTTSETPSWYVTPSHGAPGADTMCSSAFGTAGRMMDLNASSSHCPRLRPVSVPTNTSDGVRCRALSSGWNTSRLTPFAITRRTNGLYAAVLWLTPTVARCVAAER